MKKTTFFSLLAMLFLFVGSNVRAEEAWVKTEPSKLQTGDVVAIVDLTKVLVMPNNNGTSAAPAAVSVTLNDDKTEITAEVDETWMWTVIVTEEGYQFHVDGTENYLYCTNANNGVRVGTNTNNVFTIKDDFLYNTATSRYIGPYNTQDWRCYTNTTGNIAGTAIAFFKKTDEGGGEAVAKPTFSPAGGIYSGPLTVTISAGEDCYILYTTNGISPEVDQDAILVESNTATVEVTETTTIRAFALYMGANMSSEAKATYTILTPITSIAELCDAATEAREPAIVEFNNWICTGVAGSNAYFTDGKNGILLYQNGHGFELGDVLTGTAQLTLTLYNECAEIIGLTSTTEGLTVTKGEGATPMAVAIADLEKNMQGNLITIEGVTYNAEGKVFVDDDDNEIIPYNRFIKLPDLLDGKTYNVTGVAIWFKNQNKWEIAPRTADEFVLVTSLIAPVSAWSVEHENVDLESEPTARFTTDSDGVVTYTSSDESVATIDENGNITLVGQGTTTITASVAETEIYLADSKSFTLTVTEKGYAEVVFAYSDEDIQGKGEANTGAEFTVNRDDILTLEVNKAYAKDGDDHIKIYGSKYETVGEGDDAEKVLSEPSYIKLTVAEGYAIKKIVLTATSNSYIREWKDQFDNAATVEGATATWEGIESTVTLTNQATSQARLKTITVTYIDSDVITAINAPAIVKEEGAIYNLAGQRLQKLQKGINIVGGKKILK